MLFTPEYPTIDPMTLCDKGRGGWYMVVGSNVSFDQQASSACYKYTPDDQRGNNKTTITKVKASIPEPLKYTPPPPLPPPAKTSALKGEFGECDVALCCGIVKEYKDKQPQGWWYDTKDFFECKGCPQAISPDVPSMCPGADNNKGIAGGTKGGFIGCCPKTKDSTWKAANDPDCSVFANSKIDFASMCLDINQMLDGATTEIPNGCIKLDTKAYKPKESCPQACQQHSPLYEFKGQWVMNPVSTPLTHPDSSCICCKKELPAGCKEIPYDDLKGRTTRKCTYAVPGDLTSIKCEEVPYPEPTGTPFEKARQLCNTVCSVNSKTLGPVTEWDKWDWNDQYTDTGCICCKQPNP